jgi:protein-L-isoaspartate(D-aspartate) O-methyltransferase
MARVITEARVITDFEAPRQNMVESQIRTNKVTDPDLIESFSTVPRELFVPDHLSSLAYADEDIEIAPHRYLMEPLVLARLLQTAGVTEDDMVLDIGCGTGYSTAVLSRLVNTVVAVESDPELASHAVALLAQLDIDNAVVMTGPLEQGHSPQAPYDVVLLSGAVTMIPAAILGQLAEGGRLVAILMEGGQSLGRGTLIIGRNGNFSRREVFDAAVPPLPGFSGEQGFQF